MKCRPALLTFYVVLLVPFAYSGDKRARGEQTKSDANQTKKHAWPIDPGLYVGPETCKSCHEDLYKSFETTSHFITTMHGTLDTRTGPEWHGCEACHGPGKEHVDSGGDKTKIFTFKDASPQQTSAVCLGCHQ